jgi:hypothetical protein
VIQRYTTEQPFTLTLTLLPQNSEAPADPDSAAVTVEITHVNGTEILASTAATKVAVGVYTISVPAQAKPLKATITWSYAVGAVPASTVQYLDVFASHYIDLQTIRALDGINIPNGGAAYPTTMLVEKRDEAETLFEQACGMYWTPHYVREVLDGDPNYRIALQSAIRDIIDYIPYKRLVLGTRYPRELLAVAFTDPNTGIITPVVQPATTLTSSYTVGSATMNVTSTAGHSPPANPGDYTFPTAGPLKVAGILNPTQPVFETTLQYTGTTPTTFINVTGGTSGTAGIGAAVTVPLSAYYVVYPSGELEAQIGVSAFPRGIDNVVVEYMAGLSAMPSDLTLALAKYIRYLVLNTNSRIPDRATYMATEFGQFRIGQAKDWVAPTGIADVDAVLIRHGTRVPSFA